VLIEGVYVIIFATGPSLKRLYGTPRIAQITNTPSRL
jgi:hypothetical protein